MFSENTSKRLFGSDSVFNWRRSFNVCSILDNICFASFSYFSISASVFFVIGIIDDFGEVILLFFCLVNEIP